MRQRRRRLRLKEPTLALYVDAVSALTELRLQPERAAAVVVVMTRLAGFAAHIEAFEIGDDVEIAGTFRP